MSDFLDAEELLRRIEARDSTLWPENNVSADRLGWLDVPRRLAKEAGELRKWAESIDNETIVLLGMGGSSLGPLVFGAFAETFSRSNGRRLVVCDTTEPSTVGDVAYDDAYVLVSSKSGTTLEPNVLYAYARTKVSNPKRFGIITDPGTPLGQLGNELGVHRIFENQPDIGGRYSVLSYFGLVPAVLLGYDVEELCELALSIDRLEAVQLGLELGDAARTGRDKATIVVPPAQRAFGLWVEQLIAESTGKLGTGVVPVPTSDEEAGEDRFLVHVAFNEPSELASAFYRFELATAVAGHVLSIDPFDEPNVAESKTNTNRVLGELPLPTVATAEPEALAPFLREQVRPGDYVSVQAYLPFGIDNDLEALRCAIRDAHDGVAVTAGYGPRFLHSTGQLHKGGPNSLVAVQVVPRGARAELAIPDKAYDFSTLIDAQAIGDFESLNTHHRRVLRVQADSLRELHS